MKIERKEVLSQIGKPFTIIKTTYVYEPEYDGSWKEFTEIVKAQYTFPPQMEIVLGGICITEVREGHPRSAKNKTK